MTRWLTEDDLIAAIPRLTRTRLVSFIAAEIVVPVGSERGPVFRGIDSARAALACDLAEDFGLDDEGLSLVLALVDQLHGVRAELRAVMGAVEAEPPEVRRRIAETLWAARLAR